jgi:hypothetical protein
MSFLSVSHHPLTSTLPLPWLEMLPPPQTVLPHQPTRPKITTPVFLHTATLLSLWFYSPHTHMQRHVGQIWSSGKLFCLRATILLAVLHSFLSGISPNLLPSRHDQKIATSIPSTLPHCHSAFSLVPALTPTCRDTWTDLEQRKVVCVPPSCCLSYIPSCPTLRFARTSPSPPPPPPWSK